MDTGPKGGSTKLHIMLRQITEASRTNVLIAVAVALVVAMVGAWLIITNAAGFFAAVDSDSATLTANAKLVNDSGASGGKAIQFTAPAPTPPPSPTPTPPPPPPPPASGACVAGNHIAGSADPWGTCWPYDGNTGVPAGIVLAAYTGPCTLTAANTVIDKKTVNCDIVVKASGVVIQNSKVNGHIDVDGSSYSATIQDSEIIGGGNTGVGYGNVTVIRANIHGAQHSVLCGDNCIVRDSWLHGQVATSTTHNNAILSNGGNNIQAIHNTLYCQPQDIGEGGCTGDLSMFGDFDPITNVLVDKNLFLATPGGYCFAGGYQNNKPYGLQASNIDVTNNIFKRGGNNKCAAFGPVTNYDTQGGGVWSNNKWDDGAVLNP